MRVLNIMLAEALGGIESMALRYHEALKAEGLEVISAGHKKGILSCLPAPEFAPINALINHDPIAALTLKRLAHRFRPDIILSHGNRPTGICLLPFLNTANKTVQIVHNFRYKSQVRHVRAAICVSRSVLQSFIGDYPTVPAFGLDNFMPLCEWPVKPAPQKVPIMGTLGRLHGNKGLDTALAAMVRLKSSGCRIKLKIAGDGPERSALEQIVHKTGLSDRVTFTGWIDNPSSFLQGLDLFLQPSRIEPFGLVVAEAMAAGVPVLASAIDGPLQILNNGNLGILFKPDNEEDLAKAIQIALSDWTATLNRARAAQSFALRTYSFESGKSHLVDTLRQIAQIPPKRA